MGKKTVILASGSKKRSEILNGCGIRHRIIVSKVKECFKTGKSVRNITILNARRKAYAVSQKVKKGIIIGADSLVTVKGQILGKPKNRTEAEKYLYLFSGNMLSVCTGLCVIDLPSRRETSGFEISRLKVKSLSDTEIKRYLKILKPYDKAGGFSIEGAGAIIFDDIRGSYFNILGLPLFKLKELLKELSIEITDLIKNNSKRTE